MTALLWSLIAKVAPALLGAALVVSAWFAGRRGGAADERAKQAGARLDDVSEAKRIEDAIAGRSDAENREELGKWARR